MLGHFALAHVVLHGRYLVPIYVFLTYPLDGTNVGILFMNVGTYI